MDGGGRVRLAEVAAAARVSVSAASVALSGRPGVSEATRKRVADTARSLGYVRDHAAAALRSGRTGLVGFAAGDFGHPLLRELTAACAERSWLVATADPDRLDLLLARNTDALVLVGGRGATAWSRAGKPLVCVGADRVPRGATRLAAGASGAEVLEALCLLLR